MSQTRAIDIDFEVHKVIETNRNSFEETPNEVLRRLLGIAGKAPLPARAGKSFVYGNMELPHGTEARMTYNNVRYLAQIDEGSWVAAGQRHKSPSGAARAVAVTKSGRKTNLDGWRYWEVRLPGSTEWVSLTGLWQQSEKRKA